MMMELPCGANIFNRKPGENYLQILGLSSERPLVKINNQLYVGKVTDTIGSHIFLETEEEKGSDSRQTSKKLMKNVIITDKSLKLEPVYLETREEPALSSKALSTEKKSREKEGT